MHYCILVNKRQCVLIFFSRYYNFNYNKESKYFLISDAETLKRVESQQKKKKKDIEIGAHLCSMLNVTRAFKFFYLKSTSLASSSQ